MINVRNKPIALSRAVFYSLVCVAFLNAGPAEAMPHGGTVVAGNASIAQSGNVTTIHQTSQKAVINWQGFDIAANEQARFVQPNSSAIALNRITSGLPTQIAGLLTANGHVWIVNPAGVIFRSTSRVDVAGLLVTTSDIRNQDFMNGKYEFRAVPGFDRSAIVNEGEIVAHGGSVAGQGLVALVAPGVENRGIIRANLGRVVLASGTKYTVDLYGDQMIQFAVDGKVVEAPVTADGKVLKSAVSNEGLIQANGGKVLMTAKVAAQVVENVVSMNGVIEAKSVVQSKNGVIILGGDEGTVRVNGHINVSGKASGQKGGSVKVLGKKIIVSEQAKIDASGDAGGGEILVGGNYQGKGPEMNASTTQITKGSLLDASALTSGNGGKIIVWSDNGTYYEGNALATGGLNSGDGGFAEVSGKDYLAFLGEVNLLAPQGKVGTLLLDPRNLTISTGTTTGVSHVADLFTSTADSSVLNVNDLLAQLTLSNVIVQTGATGSQDGNITIATAINYNQPFERTLQFIADNNISFTSSGSISSSSANLHLEFLADDGLGGPEGRFEMASGSSINTNGGNLLIQAMDLVLNNAAGSIQLGDGDLTIKALNGVELRADNSGSRPMVISTAEQAVFSTSGTVTLRNGNTSSSMLINHLDSSGVFAGVGGTLTLDATENPASGLIINANSLPSGIFRPIVIQATDNITISDTVRSNNGTLSITSDTALITVNNGASLVTTSGDITLAAADLDLTSAGSITSNDTDSEIIVNARGGIGFGSATGEMQISQTELNKFDLANNDVTFNSGLAAPQTVTIDGLTVSGTSLFTINSTATGFSDIVINGSASSLSNYVLNANAGIQVLTTLNSVNGLMNADVDNDGGQMVIGGSGKINATGSGNVLTLIAPTFNFTPAQSINATGGGAVTLATNGSLGVGTGSGDTTLDNTFLGKIDATTLTLASGFNEAINANGLSTDANIGTLILDATSGTVGTVTFGASPSTITNALTVRANHDVTLGGNLTTNGATTLTANADSIGAGNLDIGSGVTINTQNNPLSLTANNLSIGAGASVNSGNAAMTINGTGSIGIAPLSGSFNMNISTTELGTLTASSLTINSGSNQGISVGGYSAPGITGTVTLNATAGTGGTITFQGPVTFPALVANADAGITVSGTVTTSVGSLSLDGDADNTGTGTLALGASLNAATSMVLDATSGGITLGVPVTLTAPGGITVNAAVSGAQNLTVAGTSGATIFNGALSGIGTGTGAAINLLQNAATTFNSTVTANSGISAVGPVTFTNNVTLGDGNTASTFNGNVTLDGLTFSAADGVTFGNAASDTVTLSGGPVSISSTNSPITFNSAVTGAQNLTVNSGSAQTTFNAALNDIGTGTGMAITLSGSGTTRFESTLSQIHSGMTAVGPVVFTGDVSLIGGNTASIFNGDVTLDGLTFTATNGVSFGNSASDTITLSGGTVNISSSSGTIGFNGVVALNADTTLTSNNIIFAETLDGAHQLDITGNVAFHSVIGGTTPLAGLSVSGITAIDTGTVTTTGTQTYNGAVILGADNVITASAVNFGSTLDGASNLQQGLEIFGDATFGGLVGNSVPLEYLIVHGTSSLPASVTTSGAQTYDGATTLTANTVLTGSTITFGDTLDGSFDLNILGDAAFAGIVGGSSPLDSLQVSGSADINASEITTTGAQEYDGAVVLGTDSTLNATTVTFGSTLDGTTSGQEGLTINGDATFSGGVGSSVPLEYLTVSGASTINGGEVTTQGSQTYTGAIVLGADSVMTASVVNFGSTLDGASNLQQGLEIFGDATFGGLVGDSVPLEYLIVHGTSSLPASVTTSGAQTYDGATTLTANTVLTGSTITFGNTLDGSFDLNILGDAVFAGIVGGSSPLDSLQVSGSADINASEISTTGAQEYDGAVVLTADSILNATTVTFGSTLDGTTSGQEGLTINGDATFGGGVGSSVPLEYLTVSGASTINGGEVTTQGSQTYTGAIVLGADSVMTASAVNFGSTLDGTSNFQQGLEIFGDATFGGLVGNSVPLEYLIVHGTSSLPASVTTSGAQTYDGATTLTANTVLTGSTITFGNTLDGSFDLNILGDAVFAGIVGGSSPLDSLQVSGSADINASEISTTGAQEYDGAVVLTADSILNATTVTFGSTLDGTTSGQEGLTINGDTTFGGLVGNSVPLEYLIVHGTSSLPASVTTSGAQTYDGATTLTANTVLTGSTITFGNTLDGSFDLNILGDAVFAGIVGGSSPLDSLQVSGGTHIDTSEISTTGAQEYDGAVVLGTDSTLNATTVAFGSTLDGTTSGQEGLTINGDAVFGGDVGSTVPLEYLIISGTSTINGSQIITHGNQTYAGVVTLNNDVTFDAGSTGDITFTGGVNGTGFDVVITNAHDVNAPGAITVDSFTQHAGTGQSNFSGGLTASGDITIHSGLINGNFIGDNVLLDSLSGIFGSVQAASSLTLGGSGGSDLINTIVAGIGGASTAGITQLLSGASGQFFVNGVLVGVTPVPPTPTPTPTTEAESNAPVIPDNLINQVVYSGNENARYSGAELQSGLSCVAGDSCVEIEIWMDNKFKNTVGVVTCVFGFATATDDQGQERILLPGSEIYAGEKVFTDEAGKVNLQLTNGQIKVISGGQAEVAV